MKLRCIRPITYHWGEQLVKNKEYEILSYSKNEVTLITNDKEYYDICRLVSSSAHSLRSGSDDVKESVRLHNKLLLEKQKEYTKTVKLPFITMKGESNSKHSFINLEKVDIFNMGCDKDEKGYPTFTTTNYFIGDYFETISMKRVSQLSQLGI